MMLSLQVLNTPYLVIQWAWRLAFSGYNDKLPVLLEKVLTTMRDLEVKQDRFEIIKERLTRGLKNWDFQQPYNQVGDYMRWLSSEKGYINEQYLAELPHVTVDDIQQFYPHLLRQMHIETFVHGNLYKEDALKLADLTESILKPRVLPQTQWPIDPANVNHCIEYVLTIGDKAVRPQRAKTLLLDQMTHEPAFDQLRTKEQLGYVVFSGCTTTTTTIAYRFIIQSEKTPQYLEERIDSFLVGFSKTLKSMTDSEFEGHKRSLITKRLEKLKNLDQESNRLWSHIDYEYYDFELGTSLPEVKPEEQSILAVNKDRKDAEDGEAITVNVEGNGTKPFVITDVRQFKSMLQVTAGPQPVKTYYIGILRGRNMLDGSTSPVIIHGYPRSCLDELNPCL
ncbi:hypothetical protein EYC84_011863 [Monilinia fructicola]|uniref:Peptidase M16 C-terminal domain-containing protein n=1 Tax=Monilinia fructicola TaxID=38448 RepID=A0A5M9J407_MONFR|nr:hypothetical protein EYC84_011863 [Monilinia fructicola]